MAAHQVAWRRANIASRDQGWQNGKQYEWILPQRMWEAGLYPGIRSGAPSSLPAYLEAEGVQRHQGSHNLKSSWILCANLYFPFRGSPEGRRLLAGFLRERVHPSIASVDRLELEYAEPGDSPLHPSAPARRDGRQPRRGTDVARPGLRRERRPRPDPDREQVARALLLSLLRAGQDGQRRAPSQSRPRAMPRSRRPSSPTRRGSASRSSGVGSTGSTLRPWPTPAVGAPCAPARPRRAATSCSGSRRSRRASPRRASTSSSFRAWPSTSGTRTCARASPRPASRISGSGASCSRARRSFAVFTHQEWVRWVAARGDRDAVG